MANRNHVGEAHNRTTRRRTLQAGAAIAVAPTALAPVPLAGTTAVQLPQLEEQLRRRIAGQEHVIAAVAGALRRWRAGRSGRQQSVPSFLFLGPAHVGKTVLVKALAESLFGAWDAMTRLDVGQTAALQTRLVEAVQNRPRQVILLDEIENAGPEALRTIEQLLATAQLTDDQGRTTRFRDTVVVMTSTTAGGPSGAPAGLGTAMLSRVHEIVTFKQLTPEQQRLVAQLMQVRKR